MINVQIDETYLLDLFMNRLEYWENAESVLALYRDYLEILIYGGCFENAILNIETIIDNLYVNDTTIMDKEELDRNNISIANFDKILAKNEDKDLYLVSSY